MAQSAAIKLLKLDPATANAGNKWSQDDDKILLEAYENKTDLATIAATLKRTQGSVESHVKHKIYDMIDDNNTIEALCQKYNLNVEEMKKFKKKQDEAEVKANKKLTATEAGESSGGNNDNIKIVEQLAELNKTNKEILDLLKSLAIKMLLK